MKPRAVRIGVSTLAAAAVLAWAFLAYARIGSTWMLQALAFCG